MPARKPPAPPAPRLTRDRWGFDFVNALIDGPRPDMARRLGNTIALQEYREGKDPKAAAAEWAARTSGRK